MEPESPQPVVPPKTTENPAPLKALGRHMRIGPFAWRRRTLKIKKEHPPVEFKQLVRFNLASMMLFSLFLASAIALVVRSNPWELDATFKGYVAGRPDEVFSPDGRYLAVATWDGAAHMYDLFTRKEVKTFWGHSGRLSLAAFSSNGKELFTASDGKGDGTPLTQRMYPGDLTCLVWDIETQEILASEVDNRDAVTSMRICRDGSCILPDRWSAINYNVENHFERRASRWLTARGGRRSELDGPFDEISPDGQFLFNLQDRLEVFRRGIQNTLLFHGPFTNYACHAMTPDSKHLAVGCRSGKVLLVDLEHSPDGYNEILSFGGARVESVAFSPDGERLLAQCSGGVPRVIRIKTGWIIAKADWGLSLTGTHPFSPDGKRILSTEGPNRAHIWDAYSGEKWATLETAPVAGTEFEDTSAPEIEEGVRATYGEFAGFSPDGERIVISGSAVRVYMRAFPEGWLGLLQRPETWLALFFGGWCLKRMSTRLPEAWSFVVQRWSKFRKRWKKKKLATAT